MEKINRRRALSVIAASAAAPGFIVKAEHLNQKDNEKLKIVVIGAHPDDPETLCGGTMLLFSREGHEVVSAYLTRGEAGIPGKSHSEAAKIRTIEAEKACRIINARPEFLGQIDGSCEITKNRYIEIFQFIEKEKPELVFTHWPIDSHRDHRVCASLVYDAWLRSDKSFSLYYCEAMTGEQSMNFNPAFYVDISSVIEKKRQACYVHKSQKIEESYKYFHEKMEIFRGMEAGCEFAEAFIPQNQGPAFILR